MQRGVTPHCSRRPGDRPGPGGPDIHLPVWGGTHAGAGESADYSDVHQHDRGNAHRDSHRT